MRRGFTLIELLVVIAINLKQIGLGVLMYAQDYDETFPHSGDYRPPSELLDPSGYTYWFMQIHPYINNAQIYSCPSTSVNSIRSGGLTATSPDWPNGVNYGYNVRCNRVALGDIKRPAALIVVVDGSNNYFRLRRYDEATTNYAWSYDRHNDGWNGVFADGHSKWNNLRWAANDLGPADGDAIVGHPAQ